MKRRKYRTQEPPFSVTFELTEGCNLSCAMCAVSAIQEKQGKGYKFMSIETITRAMEQIAELGWNSRIGFAMRGEPTMHPRVAEMVAVVRKYRPKTHITMLTNGGGLLRAPGPVANIQALFDAGVNVLGLDDYEHVKLIPKVMEAVSAHGEPVTGQMHPLGFRYFKYPEDLSGNPHQRRPRGTRMLVQIRDIMAQDADKKVGTHGKIFNYAGLAYPPDETMNGKRCHQPFRQLAIQQDGNVPLCCNTWNSPYEVGNVHTHTIEELWQSDAMGAAREKLIRGERDFAPCKGCNHRSYRVGLLPDLLGRGKLHKPDAQTAADIAGALSHGEHTPTVRVPWQERLKEAAK